MYRPLSTLLAMALLTACAGLPANRPGRVPSSPSGLLTAQEIAATRVHSAYDAVRQLRSGFLMRAEHRSSWSAARVVVYLDGIRTGGVEHLQGIPATVVREISFLTAAEATARYGSGHGAGALLVVTRTAGR